MCFLFSFSFLVSYSNFDTIQTVNIAIKTNLKNLAMSKEGSRFFRAAWTSQYLLLRWMGMLSVDFSGITNPIGTFLTDPWRSFVLLTISKKPHGSPSAKKHFWTGFVLNWQTGRQLFEPIRTHYRCHVNLQLIKPNIEDISLNLISSSSIFLQRITWSLISLYQHRLSEVCGG